MLLPQVSKARRKGPSGRTDKDDQTLSYTMSVLCPRGSCSHFPMCCPVTEGMLFSKSPRTITKVQNVALPPRLDLFRAGKNREV